MEKCNYFNRTVSFKLSDELVSVIDYWVSRRCDDFVSKGHFVRSAILRFDRELKSKEVLLER